MFEPEKELLRVLNEKPHKIKKIVNILVAYIYTSKGYDTKDFEDATEYVLHHGVSKEELFAEFDPSFPIETDPSKWDERYCIRELLNLENNFSQKRIEHFKKVVQKVYFNVNDESVDVPKKSMGQQPKEEIQQIAQNSKNTGLWKPIIAVIALLAIIVAVIISIIKK